MKHFLSVCVCACVYARACMHMRVGIHVLVLQNDNQPTLLIMHIDNGIISPLYSTAEEDLKGYHFQKGEVEKQLTLVKEQLRTNYTELNAAGATVKKLQDEALSMKLKLTQLKDMEEPESNSIGTLVSMFYSLFDCQF